jgi:hypothetical protein
MTPQYMLALTQAAAARCGDTGPGTVRETIEIHGPIVARKTGHVLFTATYQEGGQLRARVFRHNRCSNDGDNLQEIS